MQIPLKTIATPSTHYGSRFSGTRNFVVLRVTGVLNAVFSIFFVWLVVRLAHAGEEEMEDVLANPVVATAVGVMIISVTWHMQAGMKDIIEDYVTEERLNRLAVMLNAMFALLVAVVTLAALVKLVVWG